MQFVGGLRSDIKKKKVKLQPLRFLVDVITLAETVEEMNESQSRRYTKRTNWETSTSGIKKGTATSQKTPSANIDGVAIKNKEVTLNLKDPTVGSAKAIANPHGRPMLGKCFRCGKTEHLSNNCSNQRTIAIAKGAIQDQETGEDCEEEVDFLEPDEGENL